MILTLQIIFPILLGLLALWWIFRDNHKVSLYIKIALGFLTASFWFIIMKLQKEEEIETPVPSPNKQTPLSTEKPFEQVLEKGNNEDNTLHEIEYEIEKAADNSDDDFDDVLKRLDAHILADKNTDWREDS